MSLLISFYLALNYLRKSAHKNQSYRQAYKRLTREIKVFVLLSRLFLRYLWKNGSSLNVSFPLTLRVLIFINRS